VIPKAYIASRSGGNAFSAAEPLSRSIFSMAKPLNHELSAAEPLSRAFSAAEPLNYNI